MANLDKAQKAEFRILLITGIICAVIGAVLGVVGSYAVVRLSRRNYGNRGGIQSLSVFRQLRFARFVIRNGRDDEWLRSGGC